MSKKELEERIELLEFGNDMLYKTLNILLEHLKSEAVTEYIKQTLEKYVSDVK